MWNRRKRNTFDEIFEEMNELIKNIFESRLEPETMGKPLVWGFSMTQRGNEPPEFREFGNVNLINRMFMEGGPEYRSDIWTDSKARKPLVDIMEAEDTLHVIVEMPGVTKEDITLNSTSTSLDIRAQNGDRKYSEHVELPAKVLPDSAKATYKNGVLEVIFRYDRSDKKSIRID